MAPQRSSVTPGSERPAARAWRGSGTILVVDDELNVRRTTERILSRVGFEVLCAGSGAEALELFRANRAWVVAVVTDLSMPGMTGAALGEALRALAPELPMVLITGYGEPDGPSTLFGGTLAKPFAAGVLTGLLRELLSG